MLSCNRRGKSVRTNISLKIHIGKYWRASNSNNNNKKNHTHTQIHSVKRLRKSNLFFFLKTDFFPHFSITNQMKLVDEFLKDSYEKMRMNVILYHRKNKVSLQRFVFFWIDAHKLRLILRQHAVKISTFLFFVRTSWNYEANKRNTVYGYVVKNRNLSKFQYQRKEWRAKKTTYVPSECDGRRTKQRRMKIMYTNVLKNAEQKQNVQMAPNFYTRSNIVCQISRALYMALFFLQLLHLLLPFRWEKYLTTTLLMNVFFSRCIYSALTLTIRLNVF